MFALRTFLLRLRAVGFGIFWGLFAVWDCIVSGLRALGFHGFGWWPRKEEWVRCSSVAVGSLGVRRCRLPRIVGIVAIATGSGANGEGKKRN